MLDLLQASLGWVPDDRYARFFGWKHFENPFGRSAAWVAVDGDRIVGFRTFLRWEFEHGRTLVRAVRAVDTATHPDYQGRGVFSRLTLHALGELRADGVSFVFNTPNDLSRSGYLKMGWQVVGRAPVLFRTRSMSSFTRVLRARVPAEKWSVPTAVGHPAAEVLADSVLGLLMASQPSMVGLRTRRSPEFLRWRYGTSPLGYRALLAGDDAGDGLALFRLRRRGTALEAAICDVFVPRGARPALANLARRVLAETAADYAVIVGLPSCRGFLRLPGQGPVLAWRAVNDEVRPDAESWNLTLGDVELF